MIKLSESQQLQNKVLIDFQKYSKVFLFESSYFLSISHKISQKQLKTFDIFACIIFQCYFKKTGYYVKN